MASRYRVKTVREKAPPSERITVEATVAALDDRETDWGIRTVMTVKVHDPDAPGTTWRAWGTAPSALLPGLKVGDRIRFTARFDPSGDDPSLMFIQRPTKAENLTAAASEPEPAPEPPKPSLRDRLMDEGHAMRRALDVEQGR